MPNHPKASVKQIAIATWLGAVRPAVYFMYSRAEAIAPKSAINRKTEPVTSSQSWWIAFPKERAVVRTAPVTAFTVRLRPACWRATRAAMPALRQDETLLTASILTVPSATMTQPHRKANRCAVDRIQIGNVSRGTQWIRN